MDGRAAARRTRMTTRLFATMAEADRHDVEFWRELSPEDRLRLVWTLSVEQWQLSGRPDESGRCRSVARVHRG
jgi:hypothetical protein